MAGVVAPMLAKAVKEVPAPDSVDAATRRLPGPCVMDGEIIVRTGEPGAERLDWEALSQRIHPAESRIARLARETAASFVAFDLLADGDDDLLTLPFRDRRTRLERLLDGVPARSTSAR